MEKAEGQIKVSSSKRIVSRSVRVLATKENHFHSCFSHLDVPPSNRLELLVQPIHGHLRWGQTLRRHPGLVAAPDQDLLLRAQLLLHGGHALRLRPVTLALVPLPLLLVLRQLDHLGESEIPHDSRKKRGEFVGKLLDAFVRN